MPTTPDIPALLQSLSLSSFGLTGLDVIIFIVILLYAYEGYAAGFVNAFFDLLSFISSFILGIKFYALLGKTLVATFAFSPGVANAISFFIIAFIAEFVLSFFFRYLLRRIRSSRIQKDEVYAVSVAYVKSIDKLSGALMGMLSSFILLSFIFTVIITFPFAQVLKRAITEAKIASILIANTQGLEKMVNSVFGQAIDETINFLTIKPQSNETVALNFTLSNGTIDEKAEKEMLVLVNRERTARGLNPVVVDTPLRDVARNHAIDMFKRGYFSHYTPEGYSPFDRLVFAGISYSFSGENLALAPNTILAMQGLMNSPGHKANILSSNFGRVGIGVIDGGIYGQMFVQEFKD